MTVREYAERVGFTIVGKLTRQKNKHYGVQDNSYPWYMDEAKNEYLMTDDGKNCVCIVTAEGGVI
jgi:hypothetical protein